MHRPLMVCVLLASVIAQTGRGAAQDAPPSRRESTTDGAKKTRDAIARLRQAVAEWRRELGPDGKIDPGTAEELRSSLTALGRELGPLMAARPAAGAAPVVAPSVADMQNGWVKSLRGLGAGATERRDATVAALREALAGRDAVAQQAALGALSQTGDVKFDRTPFRPLILPLLDAPRGELAVAAFYALYNTGRRPGDLARVRSAYARHPQALARSVAHLLFLFSDGVIDGDSERIVLDVLADDDPRTRREALRGLWGAKVSATLAARLVALADDAASHGDAIYFGLSTLRDKNEAVVDKLIQSLSDPDWTNNGQRALWGLGHGVPEALQPKVAAALIELHNTRTEPGVRRGCAELVRRYGGAKAEARLER